MTFLLALIFFALGAILASFAGVISVRLNTGQSFLKGRSRCDVCDETLSPSCLIPIFSFAKTRGRSSCCGARISYMSPLSEIVLGGLCMLAYLQMGLHFSFIAFIFALFFLLTLVLYDLAHQILPPVLLGWFLGASALTMILTAGSMLVLFETLLISVAIATLLAAIHFFSGGRAMGLADAPLALGLALLTGSAAIAGFVFSFWIGAVVGILVLLKRPSGSRMGIEVPFAPFLAAGFLLAYFTQWNPFVLIRALH